MKLPDWITGGDRVAQARKTVEKYRGAADAGSLKPGQQGKLDDANGVLESRRMFLRRGVAAVVGVVAVGGLGVASKLLSGGSEDDPSHDTELPTYSSGRIDRGQEHDPVIDERISTIEQAFAKFGEKVEQLLQKSGASPEVITQMMFPFKVVELNKTFPDKNYARLRRQKEAEGSKDVYLQSPYNFYYSFGKLASNAGAGFASPERLLVLKENFDPNSLIDLMTLYHEINHSIFDVLLKSEKSLSGEYKSFQNAKGGRAKVIVNDEVMAYTGEIQVLNLLTNGELQRTVKNPNPEALAAKLGGVSRRDVDSIDVLCKLAAEYYSPGSKQERDDRLYRYIGNLYQSLGYDVFAISTTGGGIKRYNPESGLKR